MNLQKKRIAIFVMAMISGTAIAAPQGGNFAVGTGTIAVTGNNTTVDISVVPINIAVINWDSMNIGAGESLSFNNSTGVRLTAVNIDNQSSQTQINGAINSSNTSVVVVNKNGVSLGSGAQINTPSFVAASGNIDMEKAAFGQVYVDLTNAETTASQDALLNVEYDSSYTSRTYFNVNGVGAAPILLNDESRVYGGGSVSGPTAYKNSTIIADENIHYDLSGIVTSASVNLLGGHSNSVGEIRFVGDNAHLTVDNADRLHGEISGSGGMHINNTSGAFLFDNVDYKGEGGLYISSLAPEISLGGAISSDAIQLQYNNYSNPDDLSIKNSAAITANVRIENYTGGTSRLENNGKILGDGNQLVMNYMSGQANEIVNNNEISIGHISTESLKNDGTIYAETIDATTLKNTTSGEINFNASIDATNIENDGRILLNGNGSAAGAVINDGKWSSYGKIDGEVSGGGETLAGEVGFTGLGIRADTIKNTGTIDLGKPPVVEPPVVEPPVVEPPVVEPPVVEPPVVEPPVVEPPVVEPPVVEPPVVEPPVVEPPVVESPVVEPPVTTPNRGGISFSNGFFGVEQKNGEIVLGVGGSSTPIQIDIEGADINSKHEPDSVEDIF